MIFYLMIQIQINIDLLRSKVEVKELKLLQLSGNEIITALNKPDDYILAIVSVEKGKAHEPRYRWKPFLAEPSFDTVSINFNLHDLLENATPPK